MSLPKRLLLGLLMGFLSLLVLAGCGAEPTKTLPVRSGWSRGLLLGQASPAEPPAFLVRNGRAYAAWNEKEDDVSKAHMVVLDDKGRLVKDLFPELGVTFPHKMRLLAREDGLAFFFLGRYEGRKNDVLFYARLNQDGEIIGQPQPVSPGDADVENYAVVRLAYGWLVLWEAIEGNRHVLYYAVMDEEANLAKEPALFAEWGQKPVVFLDKEEVLHVAWLRLDSEGRGQVFYAHFPPGEELTGDRGQEVARFVMGLGGVSRLLTMGLDADTVYVFWDVEYRAGLLAGTTETTFVAFPHGHPEEARESILSLPSYAPDKYPGGEMPFIALPPEGARRKSDIVSSPMPAPVEQDRLFLGVSVKSWFRSKGYVQPVVALLEDGVHRGFQVAAITKGLSLYPQLLLDEQGYWHLLWIDMRAYGLYPVYYATTSPQARAELNKITPEDIGRISLETLMGMISGMGMVPLLIVAAFPSLLLVSGYHIFGGEGDLSTRGARVLLGISLVLYLGFRLLLSGPFMATIPLAVWLPQGIIAPATIGLALLQVILDILALMLYWRRSMRPVLFLAWAIFVICDTLLMVLFYGPVLLGG